jgi:hypothetical protein
MGAWQAAQPWSEGDVAAAPASPATEASTTNSGARHRIDVEDDPWAAGLSNLTEAEAELGR